MNFLKTLQLGFVFAGCFLGAGYVSGQELWQFFGSDGKMGFFSLFFAIVLFFIFGYIVLCLSKKTKITLMDEIVVPKNDGIFNIFKKITGILQIFFIIGIYIIMCAGAGALINQLFNIHIIVGSFLFCVLVLIIALKGLKGVMGIFSLFVPPLVLGAVFIGIYSVYKNGITFVVPKNEPTAYEPLLSSIIYVSYNFFGSIGILAPIAQKYKSKKDFFGGVLTGCIILALISFCILFAINSTGESINAQLPMLYIATNINKYAGYTYAVFLLGAMFGPSLSSLVAVCEYMKEKYSFTNKKTVVLTVILSISACILSLAGFDRLIGTIYPLCGIFGFFALCAIIIHYIKVMKK